MYPHRTHPQGLKERLCERYAEEIAAKAPDDGTANLSPALLDVSLKMTIELLEEYEPKTADELKAYRAVHRSTCGTRDALDLPAAISRMALLQLYVFL